ncbi:MAG: hypothetical protein ACTTIV_01955 [Campylobacter sp.]
MRSYQSEKSTESAISAKFRLKLSGEIAPNTQSVSEFISTRLVRLAFWHKMHVQMLINRPTKHKVRKIYVSFSAKFERKNLRKFGINFARYQRSILC